MMLQGLATNLGVSLSFIAPLARWAQQTLLEEARRHQRLADARCEAAAQRLQVSVAAAQAVSPIGGPLLGTAVAAGGSPRSRAAAPRSPLEERILRVLQAQLDTDVLLGAQVCAYRQGKCVLDASAGRLAPLDVRPVQCDSLFELFEASSPILAVVALQHSSVNGGAISLSSPLAAAWPAFGGGGKGSLTLIDVLSHRTGLADAAFPADATLSTLCDTPQMAESLASTSLDRRRVENPAGDGGEDGGDGGGGGGGSAGGDGDGDGGDDGHTASPPLRTGEHEGAAFGWALWGVLHTVTGRTQLLNRVRTRPRLQPAAPRRRHMPEYMPECVAVSGMASRHSVSHAACIRSAAAAAASQAP